MNDGTLIVFEGIDGSGKSTQLELLADALRARGREVVVTAEPWSGSPWGERIRAMARSGEALPPEEELTWFWRQRRDHVHELVAPSLAAGQTVLCDRYFVSTVAYQGARGLDPEVIRRESEREFPVPDLVVWLDVGVEEGLTRAGARSGPGEPVFERGDFLAAVARQLEALDLDYLVRVDATGSPEEVHQRVLAALIERGVLPA